MVKLKFTDLGFEEFDGKIRISFLKHFYFDVDKEDLRKISDFNIADANTISFKNIEENTAKRKFNFLISNRINDNLMSKIGNYKAIYVHSSSGIPLIGTNSFGLVDRNTSVIEIKPVTGCNLSCIFCSVDEGMKSRKQVDYVVEKDYLVEGFRKLAEFKAIDNVEAHIGTQGEPLLYAHTVELIKDIRKIKNVKTISINTNGVLLNEKLIDELARAGLTRINLSLNALDDKTARKLAGTAYDVKRIMDISKYIKNKLELQIAPVWVPGFNDNEIEKIIVFAKELGARIGIQNFLIYKHGRRPAKQMEWKEFYDKLLLLEKKHKVKLMLSEKDFNITKTKPLPRPFKKGDVIKAKTTCLGRWSNEVLAVANDRAITLVNYHGKFVKNKTIKVKILRSKHNIFIGKCV